MLSKIRDCFRLSGQLWIKDQPDRSRIRVLELECAVLNRLIGLPIGLYVSGRLSNCLACPSQLVGVLHRLHPPNSAEPSRVTQQRVTFCANLSRLSEAGRHVNPKGTMFYTSHEKLVDSRPKQATVGPASFAIQIKQRRLSKHRNAQTNGRGALGSFKNSTAVAWVWTPATRLRFRPSHRDQTLGLRSANPSAGSSHLRSHPIKPPVAPEPLNPCQGAKLVLHSCLSRIPCFANRCNFAIPLQNRTANHTAVS
jgi:hypothetical protein